MAVEIEVNERTRTIFLYDKASSKRAHGAIARGVDGKTLSVKPKNSMGYIVVGEGLASYDFAALGQFFMAQSAILAREEDQERVARERKQREMQERVDRVMQDVAELTRDEQIMMYKQIGQIIDVGDR